MGVVTTGHGNRNRGGRRAPSTVVPPATVEAAVWPILILSSGGVDRTIPAPVGELWEQMAAAAVSNTRSPGGGRGSALFSLS